MRFADGLKQPCPMVITLQPNPKYFFTDKSRLPHMCRQNCGHRMGAFDARLSLRGEITHTNTGVSPQGVCLISERLTARQQPTRHYCVSNNSAAMNSLAA